MFPPTYEYGLQMSVMNYIRRNGPKSFAELEESRQDLHLEKSPSNSELEGTLKKLIDGKRIILEDDKYSYNLDYQRQKESPSAIVEPRWRDDLSGFRFS